MESGTFFARVGFYIMVAIELVRMCNIMERNIADKALIASVHQEFIDNRAEQRALMAYCKMIGNKLEARE